MQKIVILLSCLVCLAAAGRLGLERHLWWLENVRQGEEGRLEQDQQQKQQQGQGGQQGQGQQQGLGQQQEHLQRLGKLSQKSLQQRQLFLLDVLLQVQKPLLNTELIQLGQELINDVGAYQEPTDELLLEFLELCREQQILGRGQIYSDSNAEHARQLVGLTKFLVLASDWRTFQRNVCFARLHINPVMFVNALMMAVNQRQDTQQLIMPAMNEILPQLFYDKDVIISAENVPWNDLIANEKSSPKPSLLNIFGLNNVLGRMVPGQLIRMGKSGIWRPWQERRMSMIDARRGMQLGGQLGGQFGPIGGHIGAQMGSQMEEQMGGQLGGLMGGQMRGQLGGLMEGQLGGLMGGQVSGQMRGLMGRQFGAQMSGRLGGQLQEQIDAGQGANLENQMSGQIEGQAGGQMRGLMGGALGGQIGGKISGQVGSQMGEQINMSDSQNKQQQILLQTEEKLVIPVEQKNPLSYLIDDVGLNMFWNSAINERLIQTLTGNQQQQGIIGQLAQRNQMQNQGIRQQERQQNILERQQTLLREELENQSIGGLQRQQNIEKIVQQQENAELKREEIDENGLPKKQLNRDQAEQMILEELNRNRLDQNRNPRQQVNKAQTEQMRNEQLMNEALGWSNTERQMGAQDAEIGMRKIGQTNAGINRKNQGELPTSDLQNQRLLYMNRRRLNEQQQRGQQQDYEEQGNRLISNGRKVQNNIQDEKLQNTGYWVKPGSDQERINWQNYLKEFNARNERLEEIQPRLKESERVANHGYWVKPDNWADEIKQHQTSRGNEQTQDNVQKWGRIISIAEQRQEGRNSQQRGQQPQPNQQQQNQQYRWQQQKSQQQINQKQQMNQPQQDTEQQDQQQHGQQQRRQQQIIQQQRSQQQRNQQQMNQQQQDYEQQDQQQRNQQGQSTQNIQYGSNIEQDLNKLPFIEGDRLMSHTKKDDNISYWTGKTSEDGVALDQDAKRLIYRNYKDESNQSRGRFPRSIKTINISPEDQLMSARSELFMQNIQQLLARINLEKISLGLEQTNTADILNEPQLLTTNGGKYQQRIVEVKQAQQQIQQSVQQLKTIIDKILRQKQIRQDDPQIMQMLGDLLTAGSGKMGNVWDELYQHINVIVYGLSKSAGMDRATVLSTPTANLREPIYHEILQSLNELISGYQQKLAPYTQSQLAETTINLQDVDVDVLVTYFDETDADMANLLDQQLLQSNVNNLQRLQKQLVARQRRLNHKQFDVSYDINSELNQRVVVRTFLGPVLPKHNDFIEASKNFILLDAFAKNLQIGSNKIVRNSRDIAWTTRDVSTMSDIYRQVMRGGDMASQQLIGSNCRFPQRLLIPRGTVDGKLMTLFIIVTPVTAEDRVLQQLVDPSQICGFGAAGMSLDTKPLNFPLDRPVVSVQPFINTNILTKPVLIMHDDRLGGGD